MPDSVLDWGIVFVLSLQGAADWLIVPMNILTFTGTAEFFLLIMPAIYWCWDSRLGLRIGIALLISLASNLILKVIIHDPRPYWFDPRVALLTEPETSFGIPSGHAQTSVVIWGLLAVHVRTTWGWAVALILILSIGISRIHLGVHFPTDVLAGWMIGILILILFLRLEDPVTRQLDAMAVSTQIALVFIISVGVILLGALVGTAVSTSWQLPADWTQNAAVQAPNDPINPLSIENLIITAGTFFGLSAGAIMLKARFDFDTGGSWLTRIGRYIVGATGVFVLWQGLGILFGLVVAEETLLGYALGYVRFAVVGVWISALGPLLFIQFRLVRPCKRQERL